jgi:hypothetical protein
VVYTEARPPKPVPNVFVTSPDPTAPCYATGGVGVSGGGWGFGANGSKLDEVCRALEIRRVAADNGALVEKIDGYLEAEVDRLIEKAKPSARSNRGGFFSD